MIRPYSVIPDLFRDLGLTRDLFIRAEISKQPLSVIPDLFRDLLEKAVILK